GIEVATGGKEDRAQDHALFILEGQSATAARVHAGGESLATVRTKLNDAMGDRHFSRAHRDQGLSDERDFFRLPKAEGHIGLLLAVPEGESKVAGDKAAGFDSRNVSPKRAANALFPCAVVLDRKEENSLIRDDDGGCS